VSSAAKVGGSGGGRMAQQNGCSMDLAVDDDGACALFHLSFLLSSARRLTIGCCWKGCW